MVMVSLKMKMQNLPTKLAASGAMKIAEKLSSISGGRVLDVATGGGASINTLMKALKDYDSFTGIDNSEKEVKSAKKRFKGQPVEISKMNAEALEFENGSFNTVCISFSLHHLEKTNKVLAEMKRVLKPGGHFIIQEMFCDGEQTEAQKTDVLQHRWKAEIDSLLGITHNRTLTRRKIKDIVSNLKLREVEAFESTHYVRCLFCEDKFACFDSKSIKFINQAIREIDNALDRLGRYPDLKTRDRLEEEGSRLKERVEKLGSAAASHLVFIGKK